MELNSLRGRGTITFLQPCRGRSGCYSTTVTFTCLKFFAIHFLISRKGARERGLWADSGRQTRSKKAQKDRQQQKPLKA